MSEISNELNSGFKCRHVIWYLHVSLIFLFVLHGGVLLGSPRGSREPITNFGGNYTSIHQSIRPLSVNA